MSPLDPMLQIAQDLGHVKGVVSGLDTKFDLIQRQMDHKLPSQPFLRMFVAMMLILSGWLGALTGLTFARKPNNMTFNVKERLHDGEMEEMTKRQEDEVNRHATRASKLRIPSGDSISND